MSNQILEDGIQPVEVSVETVAEDVTTTTEDKAFRQLTPEEIEDIKTKISDASTAFESTKYHISSERSFISKCIDFIENDVKYDGKDALGVIRLYSALNEAKEESATMNSEEYEFSMTNMHIEALYYYIQKVTGTGYKSARKLATIVEPLITALTEARANNSKLQVYLEKLNAKLHGLIDPDEEIAL